MSQEDFYYSTRYEDDFFEYRHVHVPLDIARKLPKSRLLTESEWRTLGVQQSLGWAHYMIHGPERHVMLFRRPKPGVDPVQAAAVAEIRDAGKDIDEPATTASPEKGAMEWTPDEAGDSNDDNKSGDKKPKSDDNDVGMI